MATGHHGIPGDEFAALAAGGGGPAAMRTLAAAQHSKRLLLLRGVLETGESAGGDIAVRARDAFQLLLAAHRHRPQAAAAVIRHPSVGAWALSVIPGAHRLLTAGISQAVAARWPTATPSWLGNLAAAAAIRGGLTAQIEVPEVDGKVYLPSLGAAVTGGDGSAVVRVSPDGADITSAVGRVRVSLAPVEAGPGWLPVRELRAGALHALLDDTDPLRMPANQPLSSRLSAAEAANWATALRSGWLFLPSGSAAEISAAVTSVVPCEVPPGVSQSLTSPHVFGAVAMSLPADPWSCAETLVHEAAHLKLFGVLDIVTLTGPDDGRRYYAPWRDDPRPAAGLLQGAYAFLAVTGFWRQYREAGDPGIAFRAHREFARWRSAVTLVARTLLDSGQLTAHGREFVEGMARTLTAWLTEPVPPGAQRTAQATAATHLAAWQRLHGPIPERQRQYLLPTGPVHRPGGSKSRLIRWPAAAALASG